jgi:hypothetical protein
VGGKDMKSYVKPSWAISEIVRETGLHEWVCKHGIGHPNLGGSAKKFSEDEGWDVHGCDRCCSEQEERQAAGRLQEDRKAESGFQAHSVPPAPQTSCRNCEATNPGQPDCNTIANRAKSDTVNLPPTRYEPEAYRAKPFCNSCLTEPGTPHLKMCDVKNGHPFHWVYSKEDVARERAERLLEIRRVTGETEIAIQKRYSDLLREANQRAEAAEKKLDEMGREAFKIVKSWRNKVRAETDRRTKAEARVKELEAERRKYYVEYPNKIDALNKRVKELEGMLTEKCKEIESIVVENYNLKDKVTVLSIEINALKNRIKELGG